MTQILTETMSPLEASQILLTEFQSEVLPRQARSQSKWLRKARRANLKKWQKVITLNIRSLNQWTLIITENGCNSYCKWFHNQKTYYCTIGPSFVVRMVSSHLLQRMAERTDLEGSLMGAHLFEGFHYETKLANEHAWEGSKPMACFGTHGLMLGHGIEGKYICFNTIISQDQMTSEQMDEGLEQAEKAGAKVKVIKND